MKIRKIAFAWASGAAVLLGLAAGAGAQTITGSIVGAVADPSGLPVAGANIVLTQTASGAQRTLQTGSTGDFAFNGIEPGGYDLTVDMSGFKKAERTGLNLTANERLSLGTIGLEVGSVNETVTVAAQGAAVQIASSEHSGVLTSSQVDNLMIKGRNITTMLQLLPGVVDTSSPDGPDRNFAIGLWVNGDRRNSVGTWLDGIPTQDSGVGWISTLNVSMDAVAEVKVLLNQYQAEYGRMRGAGIQMIGKSGTRDFHGSFSYFKKHEQFNANSFFNNRTVVNGKAIPKPRYRYNTFSYTIGGPVYIPKKWNTEKNKLFFFWSQEFWPQTVGVGPYYDTMPTSLERTGDFSQSLDQSGKLIPVKDPETGQPFPGNLIPQNRLDQNGLSLLKFFPLPNFSDRAVSGGAYNYVYQGEMQKPQRLQLLKVDYNATSKDLLSVTWSRQQDSQTGTLGLATPNANWPLEYRTFLTRGNIVSARYQKILTPTLINELTLGYNWRWEAETIPEDQLAKLTKSAVGFNTPQLYPNSNPHGYLPNVTFGGIPNTPNITLTNIPYEQRYPTYVVTDNVSKTWRTHNFKAGVFYNRPALNGVASSNRGSYSFATDVNNPLETGYTFANAALGMFNNTAQANRTPQQSSILKSFEWFAQDSWKVTRRLTLEIGARWVWVPPGYSNHPEAMFSLSAWKDADEVHLIYPTMVNGKRMGVDQATGLIYPAVAIGAVAPSGGNYANGMILSTQAGVPRGMIRGPGILTSPRFGFAWDVFGNGKTAVRGGFGIFESAGATGEGRAGSETRIPLVTTATVYYGPLSSIGTSPGLIFPSSATQYQDPMGVARSYNMNFGIQQNVGWDTVVDVSYVGTLGRHLRWSFNMEPLPLGTNFDPKNTDPTTGRVLPTNFLLPYTGYSGMTYNNWGASSNYHSLQTMVNRRFTKGLQLGASWTFSKWLDVVDYDDNGVSPFFPARTYNYGFSQFDRTHNLRINFLYDIPRAPWNNAFSKWVLNGWQVSGITAFISGQPSNVGFSTTNNLDITGTPSQGARIVVLGDPVLPKSERTFYRAINTDVFALPAVGTWGGGAKWLFRGPGTNNWDLSFIKNFPLHREGMRIQFRAEMYNAFNHTQFGGVDSTARFDNAGRLIQGTTFGQYNSARTPRQMQMALRFNF